jgi:uncharacterized membrane protein
MRLIYLTPIKWYAGLFTIAWIIGIIHVSLSDTPSMTVGFILGAFCALFYGLFVGVKE